MNETPMDFDEVIYALSQQILHDPRRRNAHHNLIEAMKHAAQRWPEEAEELAHNAPALLPVWAEYRANVFEDSHGDQIAGVLKKQCREAGLSKGGWGFVLKASVVAIARMATPPAGEFSALVSRLQNFARHPASAEAAPAGNAWIDVVNDFRLYDHLYPAPIIESFVAVGEAAIAVTNGVPYDRLREVVGWLDAERPLLEGKHKHLSFAEYTGMAEQYFIDESRRNEAPETEWKSLVARHEHEVRDARFLIVPLTSTRDLKEEGEAMKHCVGGYSGKCVEGISRIFSIRNPGTGKRLATLELVRQRGKDKAPTGEWRIAQVRGPCNAAVEEEVKKAANDVLDAYQYETDMEDMLDNSLVALDDPLASEFAEEGDIIEGFDYWGMSV